MTAANYAVLPAAPVRIPIWESTCFPEKKNSSHVMKTGFHGAGAWLRIMNFLKAGTVKYTFYNVQRRLFAIEKIALCNAGLFLWHHIWTKTVICI